MLIRSAFTVAAAILSVFLPKPAHAAPAAETYTISGPVIHDNLTIYFVHGKSARGPVPLTLQEALAKGAVQVTETGSVNDLQIENTGKEPVFVQSGDIVKGGRQDRVFSTSLVLPPRSGKLSVEAFCVEHGRWSARSGESGAKFDSADAALPSRETKLAMKAAGPSKATPMEQDDGTSSKQSKVWANVAGIQDRLSSNLKAPVAAPQSSTSLQLSLENDTLKAEQDKYIATLQKSGEGAADIVGYVFAVNGKLNSADLYPSNGLFKKMWPKLLRASATEAIADKGSAGTAASPSTDAVTAFLKDAEAGKPTKSAVNKDTTLETRDSASAAYFETQAASPALGGWVHKNYLAK